MFVDLVMLACCLVPNTLLTLCILSDYTDVFNK